MLNRNLISERRRLTLFHELAHLILAFEEGSDVERLCNVFANEVLLPSVVLKSLLGEYRKLEGIEIHSGKFRHIS